MTSTTNETTTTTTGASIHGLVEHCCAAWPERVALVSEQEEVTYGELNARANQLAAQLVAHGARQDQLIGLLLPRSTDFVISALAILKTGAAYLPMDPHYPPARLSAMIENAHPAAVVTSRRLRDALPAGLTVLYGDEPGSASALTVESGQPVPADCLAYVMYTSGSTGVPKGVMVPHRAVVRLVDGGDPANSFTRYGPEETLLLQSSLSFDAATYEMWGALVHGARLVIGPERPPSLAELARLLRRHRVTQLFLTTGLFHLMVDEHLAELGVLRHLMTGGDLMSAARFRRAFAELPDTSVAHVYGPTECTTFATSFPVPAGWQPTGTVPIGRPIAQTTARILDEQLQPVPVGVSGQLFLGGDGLAHGYLNDPALTATRFVPDPHSPAPGARLYATGDRACYLPDGTIDFRGRVDEQVKIRGIRVEPGEIEQTLRRHPLVRDVAVVPTGDSAEDRRLAAFLVLDNDSSGNAASGSAASDAGGGPAGIGPDGELTEVRGWLAAAVPAQLVPATWRRLPALPLNPNGKVDRGQLRALAGESRTSRASAGSTVGPEENVIAAVYCEVLGLDRVNPGDDFFALGGHSLQAMKIAARLHRQLGVEVPLSALFNHTTVAGLAAYVRRGNTSAGLPGARLRPRDDTSAPVPLARQQESVWFLDTLAGGNRAYHFQCTVQFHGDLHVDLLERALNTVIARHETLRTTFHGRLDDVEQVVADNYRMELPVVDLSGMEAAAQEIELERLIQEDLAVRFDLTKLPLIRWRLIRRSATSHVLTHVEHHLIHDGWSLSVFWQEIEECYTAWANGREPALAELPVQYADYVAWQRELTDQERQPSLDYWIERLRDLPPPANLPFAGPRPARQTFRGIMKRIEVDQRLYADLRRFSRAEGISLYATMCAGYMALLHRYTGAEDLLVGSGFANRQPGTEPLIGMFVNAVVLRVATRSSISFRQLTGEVQNAVLDAFTHQDALFPDVVAAVGPPRDQSRNPLIQTCFNFHDSAMPEFSWPGVTGQLIERSNGTAKFDLNIIGVPRAEQRAGSRGPKDTDTLAMLWEYNTDIFSDAAIAAMISDYQALLRAAIDHADRPIGGLPSQRRAVA